MWSTANAHRLFATRPLPGALLDAGIAAVAFAGTLAQLRHGGVFPSRPGLGELDATGIVLAAGSSVPILTWRRSPLRVLVVTASAGVLLAGLGYPIDLLLGPTAALFLLAASRDRQAPWTGHTTGIVIGLFAAYLAATALAQPGFPGVGLLHTGLAWAVAWFAGDRTRLRRALVADLHDRTLRAERDAERDRQLAIAEERARIARDLHDSAGHAISVIAVRAGAARLRQDPDRSRRALAAIERLARQTAEEIDQIVGTLRDGGQADGAVEAPAGLASLGTLVARHTSAGLQVTLEVSGDPRPLGAAADQAAYRVLQEALTNAARHGSGDARVRLVYGDTAVELTVTNPVPVHTPHRSGGGHGLIGMRERATLLDGSLSTERANGTFRLHARIPYRSHRS
jgi:signal transduction histidine kinase